MILNINFRKVVKAFRLIRIPIYRNALWLGVGAAIEHEPVLRYLCAREISKIIDIGANVGQFSLAARYWFPEAKILAFEPLSQVAEKYQSIFRNDQKVHFFHTAIGPTNSRVSMHVSRAVDSSSLLPIGDAQISLFPGTEESHVESVNVAPLSVFLSTKDSNEIMLLKIDVQGYEMEVLRGCESLIDKFVAIYVECSFVELYQGQALTHEVIDWLRVHGFYLSRIGLLTFDKHGTSVQGDFLFLRDDQMYP